MGEAVNLKTPLESTIHALSAWLSDSGSRLPWRASWTYLGLPPRCFFCEDDGDLGPIDLCAGCLAGLPWALDPVIESSTYAALMFREPVDEALKALKYRGDRRAARLFGALLAAAVPKLEIPEVLIPVPLHPERVCSRGFNQSWLLAKHAGDWLDRPVRKSWISRTRATLSQTGLHATERRCNVEGAFVVSPDIRKEIESLGVSRVALVDDVVTTGATLDAARLALLDAGVSSVQCWAVARAMPKNSTRPT